MKIYIEKIIDPRFETTDGFPDRDVIVGHLQHTDYRVKVKRYLRGWTPWLRITVGDSIVHDTDAGRAEVHAFDDLAKRAQQETDKQSEDLRNRRRNAAERLFRKD